MIKYCISDWERIIAYDENHPKQVVVRSLIYYSSVMHREFHLPNLKDAFYNLIEITKEQYDALTNILDYINNIYNQLSNELKYFSNCDLNYIRKYKASGKQELYFTLGQSKFFHIKNKEHFERFKQVEFRMFYIPHRIMDIYCEHDDEHDFNFLPTNFVEIQKAQFNKLSNMFYIITSQLKKMNAILEQIKFSL